MAKTYDVAIVGAGIGGLTAGALLAKAGKKVIVIEQHSIVGGYAQSFSRNKYHFDSGVHVVAGCEPCEYKNEGLIHRVLDTIGVRDQCTFTQIDPVATINISGEKITLPAGIEQVIEVLVRRFPDQGEGIKKLMKYVERINFEMRSYPDRLSVMDILLFPLKYPTLMRFGKRPINQVFDRFLSNDLLKSVLSVFCLYVATPPDRLSFAIWSEVFTCYFREKTYYCQGTYQKLADALSYAIENHAGVVRINTAVKSILVDEGEAKGLRFDDGTTIQASTVISNADLLQTIDHLLDQNSLPTKYVKKIKSMVPTPSTLIVYLVTDLDLRGMGLTHQTFCLPQPDVGACFRSCIEGKVRAMIIMIPTFADPSLAPSGRHIISLLTLAPFDHDPPWKDVKDEYGINLVQEAEKVIPGLSDHIDFMECATPATNYRYTLNTKGAMFGWECSVTQAPTKPGPETPIKNLYIAGHWTKPSGGIYGTMVSGCRAARTILGCTTIGELFELLDSSSSTMPE